MLSQTFMAPNGRRVRAEDAWRAIRQKSFASTTAGDPASSWANVTVAGGKAVRLDAAYLRHPEQAKKAANEQKWILCLGGNGEVYEFGLQESQGLSEDTKANVMVFNFRTVGASE